MTFTVRTDRRLIRPTYRSNRFALVEVVAPATRREQGRPPVHLAFVIDRSGSMAGAKLRLAKQAVEEAIGRLQADDRFAVVVYDEHVDVLMPTTHATAEARRDALARLASVEARGSTDLGAGWLHGCEQVALALTAEGVNRCLLLTDGLANVGIIDRDQLARHAGELRARGVSTSTFGVGDDFDEVLLQAMAASGGGHFYYIAEAATIRDHISSEVGETLDLVARDVTVSVTTPEGVRVESLSPYPVREHAGRTDVTLGDLTSEQQLSLVLRLQLPVRPARRRGRRGVDGHGPGRCADRGDSKAALGRMPTTRPTTPRRGTSRSIDRWRAPSRRGHGRRRWPATGWATSRVRVEPSCRRRDASAAMPDGTPSCGAS